MKINFYIIAQTLFLSFDCEILTQILNIDVEIEGRVLSPNS